MEILIIWIAYGTEESRETTLKATEEYIALLLEVAEKTPGEFGYEFGRWTAERLSTYLQEQTGIKLSSKQISRILQKKSMYISGRNTA